MRRTGLWAGMVLGVLMGATAAHAAERQLTLRDGAVGAVYVVGETGDSVELKVVFPAEQVPGYPENFYGAGYKDTAPVAAKGQMVLFDGKGPLATLRELPPLLLTFWCENDGGRQFRPEATVRLRKAQLARRLKADPELQGLAGFVFLKSANNASMGKVSIPKDADIRMKGDLEGKGRTHALIRVAQDDAGNCDGKPDNNLTINLKTEKLDASLRCCGP